MDLGQQLGVVDLDHLVERGDGLQVLSVLLRLREAGVELQAADDIEDRVLGKHELEERVFVQEEDVLEDLVEVVEALRVVEVLAHVEQVQQLLDVALVFDGDGKFLSPIKSIYNQLVYLKYCSNNT